MSLNWYVNMEGRRSPWVCNLRQACESLVVRGQWAGGIWSLSHWWAGMGWVPDVCGHARNMARLALAACCKMWKSLAQWRRLSSWYSVLVCNLVLVPDLFSPQLQPQPQPQSKTSNIPMMSSLCFFSPAISFPFLFTFLMICFNWERQSIIVSFTQGMMLSYYRGMMF